MPSLVQETCPRNLAGEEGLEVVEVDLTRMTESMSSQRLDFDAEVHKHSTSSEFFVCADNVVDGYETQELGQNHHVRFAFLRQSDSELDHVGGLSVRELASVVALIHSRRFGLESC
jgi:hypothetical protein